MPVLTFIITLITGSDTVVESDDKGEEIKFTSDGDDNEVAGITSEKNSHDNEN